MLLNEFFKRNLVEGGNLAIGQDQADTIDLKVHDRKFMVPLLNKLLVAINNSYASANKQPLWSPQTLQSRKFLSGSSLHFFDTNIPDDKFVQVKPKVGDIDTQVNKEMEQTLAQFLDAHKGKAVGPATLLGYERGNEQFSSLWAFNDPPIKVQVDLEFVEFEKDQPTDFAAFSHSSSWDDMSEGVKGVFHKFIIQSLTKLTSSDFVLRKVHKKTGKATDKPVHDSMLSFAVSSKEGGGLRAKYEPVLDATGNQEIVDGLPVFKELPPAGYERNIGKMFQAILGHRVNEKQLQAALPKTWSFTGLLDLANAVCSPEEKQNLVTSMIEKCYAKGAQGLYKNDPKRDAEEKDAALNVMFKKLGVNAPPELKQMRQEYMSTYRRVAESLREADEQPAVKAQLRKGMPHLHDLKAADFLDLLDEIHDGNGRFKLENIPLNVKVDGFGGRFGKNKEGKPFMGTSRTEPRYEASFVKYHQQKGTTDPEILGRAQMFDDLFAEMMNAIKLVDSKLGPDFLINKQVTCEVLFLPFAQETDDGKLKFVGIHYDKLPEGVQLALVPFHAVEADTGEPVEDPKFIDDLLGVGNQGSVMFINNRLTQKEGLDVTEIINVLDNIDELKQIVSDTHGKRDRASLELKKQVEEKLKPIKEKLEQAIISDPNIIGKDMLGKDYEGIVINSRLGPIKVTSQEQRDVISAKLDAKKNARTERPRDNGNKTAVVAIGSFVGHKGHQQLFDYTINKAHELGGDPYLFMGNAVGKDDPIPIPDKIKTWQLLYPQYSKNISAVTMEGGSLMQKIKHELINPLPGKPPRYDNIVIMVGEDQAKMPIANALMKAVNKFQGYEHVKAHLEVTPRGTGMSFTKLRNVLKDGNPNEQYTMWNDAFNGGEFGAKKLPPEWIKHLMDVTKKGMGIKTPSVTAPVKKQEQPAMAKPQPPIQQQPEQEPIAESLRREIMIKRAEIAWQRELLEHQNGSQMAGPSGPAWDKTGGHHRLSEQGLDPAKRTKLIQFIARVKGWGISDLELAKDSELIYMYKKIKAGEEIENEDHSDATKGWGQGAGSTAFGSRIHPSSTGRNGQGTNGGGMNEAPIEMDPADPMNPMIYGHNANPAKLKDRMARASGQLKDLAQRAQNASPLEWESIARHFQELTMNIEQIRHALDELAKQRKKGGIKSRGIDPHIGETKQRLDPKCWKGYRKAGTKMKGGKRVNNCVPIGEGWESVMSDAVSKLIENFADGKNPGRKGLAKRSGVNTKASVSSLRKTAKNSSGEKARMAHWLANMKAGKAKHKEGISEAFTPSDVHKMADKKGIAWDNDKKFMSLSKKLTGKSHLDQMSSDELGIVYKHLKNTK